MVASGVEEGPTIEVVGSRHGSVLPQGTTFRALGGPLDAGNVTTGDLAVPLWRTLGPRRGG